MSAIASVIGRGVVASRPAAGIAGQLYFATDVSGGTLQRDNGSSWDAVEGAPGATTLAADTDANISSPANHDLLQFSTGDSKWHNVPIGTVISAALSGDVTMTTATTFYDGPVAAVTAGVWLVFSQLVLLSGTVTSQAITGKLWDGTTTIAAVEAETTATGFVLPVGAFGVYVASGAANLKLSLTSSQNTNTIKAAPTASSPGNFASTIFAVRIA